MIVFRVGENADMPSGFGNVVRDGSQGRTSSYKIEGDKLITLVSQDPYAWTFHKLGDTYYAARSNEFGYANYEIIAAPQAAVNPLTEIANQFSTELGLTQQQKEQILPILTRRDQAAAGAQGEHRAQLARRSSRSCGASACPLTRRSSRCSMRSSR